MMEIQNLTFVQFNFWRLNYKTRFSSLEHDTEIKRKKWWQQCYAN